MTTGEIIALGGLAVLGYFLLGKVSGTGSALPPPAYVPPPGTLSGLSSNGYVAAAQIGYRAITNPNQVNHEIFGVGTDSFQTFGDASDFSKLMSNTHACQTGAQPACEAVYEQAPEMQCDSSFCDQDPNTNNGHGSAVDLGNGTFRYNYRGQVGLIAHYGKKVPIGGCFTVGRKFDNVSDGIKRANTNQADGWCAGLPLGATA
jgi:hypothetical protein